MCQSRWRGVAAATAQHEGEGDGCGDEQERADADSAVERPGGAGAGFLWERGDGLGAVALCLGLVGFQGKDLVELRGGGVVVVAKIPDAIRWRTWW
jgi:hypothetical protein